MRKWCPAGHPRRDVGEDQVVPAEAGDQAVARGEIDALRPLRLADEPADIGDGSIHVEPPHEIGPRYNM